MSTKKLKRELQKEALTRLEDASRSEDEFIAVMEWWDRLDKNRERKERYHEIGRSDVPLEWGAPDDTIVIPNPIQHIFWKQILKGEFLDAIFDCPFEMHELVTDRDIATEATQEISDNSRRTDKKRELQLANKRKIFFIIVCKKASSIKFLLTGSHRIDMIVI